jgi:hypothetical protein
MEQKYKKNLLYSNPKKVYSNAKSYLGDDVNIEISTRKDKKYMIEKPDGKWVHFGSFNPPMEDYTKHEDEYRRINYLVRSSNIKGNWINDMYSPNNLSMRILWN